MYETLVFLGCTSPSVGNNNNAADVLTSIWNGFAKQGGGAGDVENVNGQPLAYYGTWTVKSEGTPGILKNLDGQCGDWTRFLLDVLKAQGLVFPNAITVVGSGNPAVFLMINDWTFAGAKKEVNVNGFEYVNVLGGNPTLDAAGLKKWTDTTLQRGTYVWGSPQQVTYTPGGLPGQNNQAPFALFPNHSLVLINGTYYDPSYGMAYTSLQDFSNKAVAAFWTPAGYK